MAIRLQAWILRLSARTHLLVGLGALVAVLLLKLLAGPDVGFSAVALLPVAYVTWFVSRPAGIEAAAAAAAGLFLANAWRLHRYPTAGIDFWNALMDLVVFVFVAWLLSETQRQYRRVEQLAREDPLTGLLNRRAFLDAVRLECRRAERQQSPLTLAYIDVDNFKAINDTHGHATGDRCLKIVAQTLTRVIRDIDVAGRLGGDEFAVLLTAITAASPAAVLAEVAQALRGARESDCPAISFSVGAVTFRHPAGDPQGLLREADGLMYQAKQGGKNRLIHEWR